MSEAAGVPEKHRERIEDLIRAGALAAAASVAPGSNEVIAALWPPPWQRRIERVARDLQVGLDALAARVNRSVPELLQDEAFYTFVLQTAQVAIRSHQDRKREILQSVLVNAGTPNAPSEDQQFMFLRLVDELTPTHIAVLEVLDDPARWAPDAGSAQMYAPQLVEVALRANDESSLRLCRAVTLELSNRGLIGPLVEFQNSPATSSGRLLTDYGTAFIRFLRPPRDL